MVDGRPEKTNLFAKMQILKTISQVEGKTEDLSQIEYQKKET
jgi:hypothetical protein